MTFPNPWSASRFSRSQVVRHNLNAVVLVMTRMRLMDDWYFAGDYIHTDKHPRT
jgi:hypothetical protein